MTLLCKLGRHKFGTVTLAYRARYRTYGIWSAKQRCSRCGCRREVVGAAAELVGGIRGGG